MLCLILNLVDSCNSGTTKFSIYKFSTVEVQLQLYLEGTKFSRRAYETTTVSYSIVNGRRRLAKLRTHTQYLNLVSW
eukprot:SAG31_NODE_18793_length_622_cov_1.290631_1_plen_76_part_10